MDYAITVVPHFPLCPPPPNIPFPPAIPTLSSYPWVMHLSSLASPFPILFLTSLCHFVLNNLGFIIPSPFLPLPRPPSQPATIPVFFLTMILYLFCLFT